MLLCTLQAVYDDECRRYTSFFVENQDVIVYFIHFALFISVEFCSAGHLLEVGRLDFLLLLEVDRAFYIGVYSLLRHNTKI